jgi:glycosyltransferase involved in cell wall biosynthesis
LVAVGERVRDELLAAGIGEPDQFRIVPPGIAIPNVLDRDQARDALGIARDARVVAFIGRLVPIKRLDRLVDAFALVAAEDPRARLVVAGGGEMEAELARRIEPIRDQVHLIGWCSDVGPVLGAADLAVITSDNEGMPVSLIEAAMVGIPSVTTDVGSAREVVLDGTTGLVCSTDPAELANAMSLLLRDDAIRHEMGAAARHRALDQFSEDALVDRMAAIYDDLLAGTTPRRRRSRDLARRAGALSR